MKKIFLSILTLAFVFNCSNNSTSSVPSEDDTATFNKNVEAWKQAISGFTSEAFKVIVFLQIPSGIIKKL